MVNGHNDERNVPDERHTHSPAHDTDAEPSPETVTLAGVANAQDAGDRRVRQGFPTQGHASTWGSH